MAVEERDPHTGYLTTGHEWNGIKELNTPVPRPIYYFLGAAVAFDVVPRDGERLRVDYVRGA